MLVTSLYRIIGWLGGLRRRRARVHIAASTLSVNSLRQTVHTHYASVPQAALLVAALWVYDSRHLQADCQEPGSAVEPYAQ